MRVRLHHFGWGLLTRPHGSPALHHQKFLNDHFWEASLQVSASKMESFHELRFPSVRAAWLASRLTACALSAMGRHPCPHRGILRAWPQNQRTGRLTSAISAAAAMKTTREAYVTRRGTRPSPACTDRVCRLARSMRKTDTATSGAPEFRPPPGCKLWGAGWPEPWVWARPFWAAAPAESRTAPSQTAPPTISGGGGGSQPTHRNDAWPPRVSWGQTPRRPSCPASAPSSVHCKAPGQEEFCRPRVRGRVSLSVW